MSRPSQSSSSSSQSSQSSGLSAAAQQQISAGFAAAAAAAAKYGESLHRSSQQSAALAQMQLGSFVQSRGPSLHSQSSPALDSLYHFAGSHHEPGTGPPYFGGGGGGGGGSSGGGGRKPSLISGYHNPSIGGSNGPNLSGAINPLSLPGGAFYSSMMSAGLGDELFGKGNKPPSLVSGGGGGGGGKLNSSASPLPSRTPSANPSAAAAAAAQMNSFAALTQPLISAATAGLALKGIGPNHPQYQLFLQDEIQQLKHKDPQQLFQIQMQREKQIYSQLQQQQQQPAPLQHQQRNASSSSLINSSSSSSASSHSSSASSVEMPKKEPVVQATPPAPQPPPPPPQPSQHHQNHHHHHHSSLIGSQNAMSSSSYVPQVEAISPTPEDQRENSNLQAIKDKIITEIYKVEKDFASTQYQLEMIKKKQTELAELQSRQVTAASATTSSSQTVVNLPAPETTMTLAEKIYQENRKKADESHRQVLKPMQNTMTASSVHAVPPLDGKTTVPDANSIEDCIPFYHEFSDSKQYYDMRAHYEQHLKPRLIQIIKRETLLRKQKERSMADKYDEMHAVWQKKCDRFENSVRKKQKDAKHRELFEKIFPELRKQREERERLLQKQRAAADPATAAAAANAGNLATTGAAAAASSATPSKPGETPAATESQSTAAADASELTALEDERRRVIHLAVVPPLCLDSRQRRYKFINTNGYVQDPVALFKAAKNEVYWTEKEKEIFLEKLLTFGKNFEIISTYLEKKRVQDCIEYYYLTKKKVNYKMLIRKHQRKRKREVKTTGGGGGGGGAGASGSGSSSSNTNNSNSGNSSSSSSTNQNSGSTGTSAISGSNVNSAHTNSVSKETTQSLSPIGHVRNRSRNKISREALRKILRHLTTAAKENSATTPLVAWQPSRERSGFVADMLRQLSNPGPEQTTIMVYTASVDNSPRSHGNSNGGKSPENSNDETANPANAAIEENPTQNVAQSNDKVENRGNSPAVTSGASSSNEAPNPPPLKPGQISNLIHDAIKNALNTDIELPKSIAEGQPTVKSPGPPPPTTESTTIKNNESIVVVNKPLSSNHVKRDEDVNHDGPVPRLDPTMKISSSISFVVDHLTRGNESPGTSPSVSPQPSGQARKKEATSSQETPSTAPKTAFSHITDLISKELKSADPMPPPPAPSTSAVDVPAKATSEVSAPSQEPNATSALPTSSNGCTLGTWVDTLISKRMYDDIASSPPGRAKITTAAMIQANAAVSTTSAVSTDQLFDIHANRMKSNFSSDMSHYARLKAQAAGTPPPAQSDPRSAEAPVTPAQNEVLKALKTSERAPSASGSTVSSSSVSSPNSSLSVSPNNNETPYSMGRRPSDYDGESKPGAASSPPEAKKSKLTDYQADGEEGGTSSKVRKMADSQAERSAEVTRDDGPPEQPFLVRSRKSSLTMKILQGSNDHHSNSQESASAATASSASSSTTRPTAPAPAENVWNNMLGGLIKKSLEEELPPPLNISELHSSVRPVPPTLLPSPKGDGSASATKRPSIPYNDDNVVDITADDSAPTPQQQAALAAIAAVSGIHTKDLIMQARSYGQQVQSAKPSTPGRPVVPPQPPMNPSSAHRLAMEQIASAGLNPQQQQQLMSYLTAQNGVRFNQPGANSAPGSNSGGNPMDLLIRKQIQEIEQQQQRAGPGRPHPGMLPPRPSFSPRNTTGNSMTASPSPPAPSQLTASYSPASHPKPPTNGPGGLSPNLMAAIMSATTAALAGSPSMNSVLIERTASAVAAAAAAYMSSPLFGGDAGMLDPMVLQQIIHAVCSTTNIASLNEPPGGMVPKLKTPQLPPNSSNFMRTSPADIAGAHAYLQQQQHQHMLQQQQQQLQAAAAAHQHHQSPSASSLHGGSTLHPSYLHSPSQSSRLKSPHHPYASLAESMLSDPAAAQALLASSAHHHQQRMNSMASPLVVQHGLKNPTNTGGSPSSQPTATSAIGPSSATPHQQSFKKRLLSSLEATTAGSTSQPQPPHPPPSLSNNNMSGSNFAALKMANNALGAKTQYEYLSDTDQ